MKRSGFAVMARLIGLVKPLTGYMILAILMGLTGHLCAAFITICGGFAVLDVLGCDTPLGLPALFVPVILMAVLRAALRYGEQACNHFIAFRLLALIRDKVFQALRKLAPAKLEGRDRGDLISIVTSDIELLEVFYAHTISPAAIALLFSLILCLFIGQYHPALGLLAAAAYLVVGIAVPLITSRLSGEDGMRFRTGAGDLSSFVLDILEEAPVVEEVTGREEIVFTGAAAEAVCFSYGEEPILDHVSVEVPRGQIVGIVGRSGSGKSTLLKLFMRFWEVQAGQVCLSRRPVGEINTENLRNLESFVTQETYLFHDSIRNNLRIARLDATDDEIIAACKKASVHDFIMSLPQGYDTPVGELGDTLSGGERQRLGLARAFLHDAPLMLLDEPTSNLDSLNEAVILRSLREEGEGRTVVLASHRASTMRIADKVYSVEHGRMS